MKTPTLAPHPFTCPAQYITPTAHEKAELARYAASLPVGHDNKSCAEYFSQAADGEQCTLSFYDSMMGAYRAWLIHS